MDSHKKEKPEVSKTVLKAEDIRKLLQYIEGIQYGSVTLYIQDGKVIQIEKTEKIKLK